MKINFKKLSDTATKPFKAFPTDAGFDLFADADITLAYGETKVIPTNIALELPDGFMADVRPRSGLTRDTALRVHYGTIDASYRGGVGIICENADHHTNSFNVSEGFLQNSMLEIIGVEIETDIEIKRGDKIAQLVIQKIPDIELVEADELNETARGAGGFGSTGV